MASLDTDASTEGLGLGLDITKLGALDIGTGVLGSTSMDSSVTARVSGTTWMDPSQEPES